MDINDLESAINSTKNKEKKEEEPQMSSEQEIGFHKGSLNTLLTERKELIKIVGNIEGIIQAHVKRLKELGVEIK